LSVGIHFRYVLVIYLVRVRRNNVRLASSLKPPLPSISAAMISYKEYTIFGDFLPVKRTIRIF